MRRIAVLLSVIGLFAAAPAAAGAGRDSAHRPHTSVRAHQHDGLRPSRLEAQVARADGRLRVRAMVGLVNLQPRPRTVHLRIGRCTGGTTGTPGCPTARRIALRIRPRTAATFVRATTLRQPPPRTDRIELSLTTSARAQPPYGVSRHLGALLLRGTAWRGPLGGQRFGAALTAVEGVEPVRLVLDGAGVTPDVLRPQVLWQARAGDRASRLATRLSPCDLTGRCRELTAAKAVAAGPRATTFARRPTLRRGQARAYALRVTAPRGGVVLRARLPWPG
ncbi:MAG TPA: hypothetical protein VD931_02830 [Baekduia sp.]|nr:hypothetical protein [Baekduia sp.]